MLVTHEERSESQVSASLVQVDDVGGEVLLVDGRRGRGRHLLRLLLLRLLGHLLRLLLLLLLLVLGGNSIV